jgi:glucose/mannose transport system substrate-binding protein
VVVDDPAQNTLIFESMLLGLKGPDFYHKTFEALEFSALRSSDMVDVFENFNQLRPMLNGFKYANWEEAGSALSAGRGAVMFSGSWSGPTFSDMNGQIVEHIMCEPLPEASATFLYNLNSVVLFKGTQVAQAASFANSIFSEHLLTDLNVNQGSIPARLDISPWGFDRCSVRAMREFRSAHSINTLKPSLAVGMATNEMVQKNVYDAINEFVNTPSMTPEEGANNLAKAIRVAVYRM